MKNQKRVIVIGAGASGLMAACLCARGGAFVTLLEKNTIVGKKLSMTGNGRANLTNNLMDASCYNPEASELVSNLIERFGTKKVREFFFDIGILTHDEDGYVYPVSGEASSVVRAMELSALQAGVRLMTSVQVKKIVHQSPQSQNGTGVNPVSQEHKSRFVVVADFLDTPDKNKSACSQQSKSQFQEIKNKRRYFEGDFVILACGGLAGPVSCMATGDGYYMAEQLGLVVTDRFPALTGLKSPDACISTKTGIRVWAKVTLSDGNRTYGSEEGEVQITQGSLSGIPVMQLSRQVAPLLKKNKKLSLHLDLLPHLSETTFEELVKTRLMTKEQMHCVHEEDDRGYNEEILIKQKGESSLSDFLIGLAPSALNMLLTERFGLSSETSLSSVDTEVLNRILQAHRKLSFRITDVCDYSRAQVTAGGIRLDALSNDLESTQMKGFFAVGEVVDVDGRCGGYNLQFAFMSAMAATFKILSS